MSINANVAKKYDIEYGARYRAEDFDSLLERIEEKYPEVVTWHDNGNDTMELSKLELEKARDDGELAEELRKFAGELLDSSDPNYDDVHVDVF